MYAEIMSAIEGIRAARDVISASNDLRNFNELTSALSKVYADLIAAQEAALSAQQARAALENEVGLLKEEVVRLKDFHAYKERYRLHALESGMLVYAHKDGMEDGEPPHYLCQNCTDQGKVARLQPVRLGRITRYICAHCRVQVQ
jgi:hypothetical protein